MTPTNDDDADEDDADAASDNGSTAAGHRSTHPINLTDKNPNVEIDLDEDNFADLDAQAAEYSKSHPEETIPEAEKTCRLAAVNLDWDHVRASHLYKIFSSLVSPTATRNTILPEPDKSETGVRSSG